MLWLMNPGAIHVLSSGVQRGHGARALKCLSGNSLLCRRPTLTEQDVSITADHHSALNKASKPFIHSTAIKSLHVTVCVSGEVKWVNIAKVGRWRGREPSVFWWYALILCSACANGCHPRQIRRTNSKGLCMLNSTLLGFRSLFTHCNCVYKTLLLFLPGLQTWSGDCCIQNGSCSRFVFMLERVFS